MSFSDDDDDMEIFDMAALDEIAAIEQAHAAGALPPRTLVNKPGLQQRDLFGGIVAPKPVAGSSKGPGTAAGAKKSANGAGGSGSGPKGTDTMAKVRQSKVWDRGAFAKHGWSKKAAATAKEKKAKAKGKGKAHGSDEEAWDEDEEVADDSEEEEFVCDPNFDSNAPLLPLKSKVDLEAAKTWQYPVQDDKPLRTYQYNIVHKALFEDTLVSLPTGLGKTFIAACVMLNFYRWYPKGKIVFLAPTRPLVTQQIKACHYIAGIPQVECIELTGHTPPSLRGLAWSTKRVIYCTPQTLENDLRKGRVDPRDITCLVVDEAHRATGDYAYVGVVRFIMSRNSHFRILALTATPGSNGEAVQEVIDNLHIGKIEVRTDESMDIKKYVHLKSYDLTVVPLGPLLVALRDRWASIMQIYLRPLLAARLVFESDPTLLSPYGVQMANKKINYLPGGTRANGKYYPMIKSLAAMARGMEYLIVHSLTSFHSLLKDFESTGPKTLTNGSDFKRVMTEVNQFRNTPGYVGHPKMDALRKMCVEHFEKAEEDSIEKGEEVQTRVMVFCNFRAVVDEIVECLNQQKPLIKAVAFVGQGTAKGVKGTTQKEQIETIKKFKKGIYNVLVATSIGEEGLDIGEIDLIVCYEANKSPIRMLQRVGRTGRQRNGRIIVLMTEGREEKNWSKAKDAYSEVQNALVSNKVFDLYNDGDRMLPPGIKPVCDQLSISALPLDISLMTMGAQGQLERKHTAEEKKRKAEERKQRMTLPDDAFNGFRTAGDLLNKNKKKREAAASPSEELRERKRLAYLSTEEEAELKERQHTLSGSIVKADELDLVNVEFDRKEVRPPIKITSHSTRHNQLVKSLALCDALDDSKPENLDTWHDDMSTAFKHDSVTLWNPEKRSKNVPPHTRIQSRLAPFMEEGESMGEMAASWMMTQS